MDTFVKHWQDFASLAIVALAVVLMIRSALIRKNMKNNCSNCALMEMKKKELYKEK